MSKAQKQKPGPAIIVSRDMTPDYVAVAEADKRRAAAQMLGKLGGAKRKAQAKADPAAWVALSRKGGLAKAAKQQQKDKSK